MKTAHLNLDNLRLNLKSLNSTRYGDIRDLIETTKDFPSVEDWTATVRAMFMLYDTYEFNLTEANRGNIIYQVYDQQL